MKTYKAKCCGTCKHRSHITFEDGDDYGQQTTRSRKFCKKDWPGGLDKTLYSLTDAESKYVRENYIESDDVCEQYERR